MLSATAKRITVLNPTAPPREGRQVRAARLPDLRGRVVGFLWNTKPNGDALFGRLEELLRHKYEIAAAVHRRKATSSIAAPEGMVDELAASVQAAVVGLGD